MKVPEKFKFSFDPETSGNPALQNRVGLILWASIKTQHLTSQHFNDDVLAVAHRVEKEDPQSYEEFAEIIAESNLTKFGQVCIEETMFSSSYAIDNEFWGGVWLYVKGAKRPIIEKD